MYTAAFAILLASSAFAAQAPVPVMQLENAIYEAGDYRELIVRFNDGVQASEKAALHKKLGMVKDESRKLLPQMEVVKLEQIHWGRGAEVLRAYKNSPLVKYASPNYRAARRLPPIDSLLSATAEAGVVSSSTQLPNDPYFNNQWSMASGIHIDVPGAWISSNGSKDVIVAVVDTGVEYTHEDLAGNVWINKAEIAANGIDDDGNGYIDDVYGWDFIAKTPMTGDFHSHGSHVSGVIGAATNNGKGIAGINWNASIMAIRAVPNDDDETDADVIEAFLYAAKNGARVVNGSFGKAQSSVAVNEAIESLKDQVLFVFAAGNDGRDNDKRPSYPAAFPADNIIAVAASAETDVLTYFSNYGKKTVDITAPGDHIWSVVRSRYGAMSGTSMASPHVAGAAAMVLSVRPQLTPLQVKEALLESGTALDHLRGKTVSGKLLNVKAAVDYAVTHF